MISPESKNNINILIYLLIILIFIGDIISPLNMIIWLFYLLPIFLTIWETNKTNDTLLASFICTILLFAGYFFSPSVSPSKINILYRISCVILFWISAAQIILIKQKIKKINNQNRLRHAINRINQKIITIRNKEELYNDICRIAVESGNFERAWIGEINRDTKEVIAAALYENENYTVSNTSKNTHPTDFLKKNHFEDSNNSTASFPFKVSGKLNGVLNLYSSEKNIFNAGSTKLLEETAKGLGTILVSFESKIKPVSSNENFSGNGELFQHLFANSPHAIVLWDPDKTITDWNKQAEKIFKWKREEVIGKCFPDIIATEEEKLKTATNVDFIFQDFSDRIILRNNVTKDGKTIFCEWYNSLFSNSRETDFTIVSWAKDITKEKEAEEQINNLMHSERNSREKAEKTGELLNNVLNRISDGFVALDKNLVYTYVNKVAGELLKRNCEELIGKHIWTEFPESINLPFYQNYNKAIQTQQPVYMEDHFPELDRCFESRIYPSKNGLTVFFHEITERKLFEKKLTSLNEELENRVAERTMELEQLNKELEAFSYSVSHDLRAPLRHINGFVDLLVKNSKGKLDSKGLRYLEIISDSSQRMGRLIDDLLTFSRMGRGVLKKEYFSINELIEEILREHQTDFADRNIQWIISQIPEAYGDLPMLKIVLINLITNAIKYTRPVEEAIIEINGYIQGEELILSVKDNGVGFDMKYADKLFGVFQRLHSGKDFEGTGIGLANIRRIISRHGGRTWAESIINQGATFYFSLPILKEK